MQPYNVYAIGQVAQIEAFQTDEDGDPESPTSPQILVKLEGSEVETSLAVTEDPEGHIYHRLRLLGPAGRYFWRIVTADDALEGFFVVKASEFAEPLP